MTPPVPTVFQPHLRIKYQYVVVWNVAQPKYFLSIISLVGCVLFNLNTSKRHRNYPNMTRVVTEPLPFLD